MQKIRGPRTARWQGFDSSVDSVSEKMLDDRGTTDGEGDRGRVARAEGLESHSHYAVEYDQRRFNARAETYPSQLREATLVLSDVAAMKACPVACTPPTVTMSLYTSLKVLVSANMSREKAELTPANYFHRQSYSQQ